MRTLYLTVFLLFAAALLLARGGWQDPASGWLYVYEANEGEDQYNAGFWSTSPNGCLDGTWMRSESSDQWDGSAPGEVGMAPGGVGVIELAGEAEDGGDAWVLSIEDTGDPRPTWPDPGNRKMYLAKDMTGQLSLADGITLCARLRLNPEPVDAACDFCPDEGNGMELHDANKGMLGFSESGVATLAMCLTDLQTLSLLDDESVTVPLAEPIFIDDLGQTSTEWLTVWFTAITDTDTGGVQVALFLNGGDTPWYPYEEEVFTGIPVNHEGGARPDVYINIAAGATPQDAAWQLDYFCVASGYNIPEPEVTGCPGALVCTVNEDDVELAWDNRGVTTIESFAIERDGVVLNPSLPADTTSYVDQDRPPGAYAYTVTPTVTGQDCPPMECTVNLCPGGLACAVRGQDVTLTWMNRALYSGIVIERDGVEIATIAGTEQTYSEQLTEAGDYAYTVGPVGGTCTALSCSVTVQAPIPEETEDFNPPEDRWGYEYDPQPGDTDEDMRLYDPVSGSLDPGCLDGTWARHNGSDRWDGTAPGEVDTTTDVNPADGQLDGAAPGGLALDVVTGGAPDGGDAGVLSCEDAVNVDGAITWEGVALDWADAVDQAIADSGSNRKIYLGHNFNDLAADVVPEALLDEGLTVNVRARLTPPDAVVDFAGIGATAPDGVAPQGNGKGIVAVYYLPELPDDVINPVRKFSVYLWGEADGTYWLQIGGEDETTADNCIRIYLGDTVEAATQFLNMWITIERVSFEPADPIRHTVTLYLNGSREPYATKEIALSTGDAENESGWGNVVLLGSMSTPEIAAFQIDFIRLAAGVNVPGEEVQTGVFVRMGDANGDGKPDIADAIYVLSYLFAQAASPVCMKAADANNDGKIDIADAINLLGFLFAQGTMIAPDGSGIAGTSPCVEYQGLDTGVPINDLPYCEAQCTPPK